MNVHADEIVLVATEMDVEAIKDFFTNQGWLVSSEEEVKNSRKLTDILYFKVTFSKHCR